ncbi:hypothetical protein RJ640_009994 [Escallonia rubra]|uniref:WAT1-related protein n=1 Tax=Escallonia rubra TaxID=112253 RepID=A0AA88S0J2_9ASTE|nr:hypothetical protein RJ640_009994 [Escallonia rubra]
MDGKRPYLAVILIRIIYAGMFLFTKEALNVGMNAFVFVFYRQAAATVFLIPLAMLFEWKSAPPMSLAILCKIFMLSLCGISLSLNLNGVAIKYTSASLAAATANCLPVITFFFAALFRMEKVKLRTIPGMAKVAGIAVCTAGAAAIAFYEGPHLKLLLHHHLLGHHSKEHHEVHVPSNQTWLKGVFLMLLSNTTWGLGLVLQAQVMKCYPSKLLFTTLQCFLSSVQSLIVAISFERELDQWKLGWNVGLLAVVYCGLVVTGVTYYLQAWVIEKKGPVFLAMSMPLSLVLTILVSAFLFGEIVNLGSVIGGILLVIGLYCVLWGKSKEQKMDDGMPSTSDVEKECSDSKEAVAIKSPPPILL